MWETAAKAVINAITLERIGNLGEDDKNGYESYCLIYRMATVGSASSCSIRIIDKGLEPIHAGILYLGRRFYLENLSKLTDVVNDRTLSKGELMPLSFGDRIRIARLDMRILQRSQIFIDRVRSF
jgi:predicted component of type VI protein secretion system